MRRQPRIGIFVPAYRASKTIEGTLGVIPSDVWENVEEVFVQDNHSDDGTYDRVVAFREASGVDKLNVHRFPANYGYGGSLKRALAYSIHQGFDVMVEFHADGQHPAHRILDLVDLLYDGDCDVAYGSRVDRMAGGMPIYKVIGNNFLNRVEEFAFGFGLKEYHSGFHAYRCEAIKHIPYMQCSDGYNITADILAMCKMFGLRVGEIEVSTYYGPDVSACSAGTSVRYGFQVFRLLADFYMARLRIYQHPRFRPTSEEETAKRDALIIERLGK